MTRITPALLLTLTAFGPPLVAAHHSYAAFDSSRTQSIEGTVGTVNWVSPHVAFTLLVSKGSLAPEEWKIESSSPSILARYGWTPATLRPGERISVVCNPLSDGSHRGRLHTVLFLRTGKTLETKLSTSLKAPQD
jgi:Family of unknown function (DUF6152)